MAKNDLPTEAAALAEYLAKLTPAQLAALETELVSKFDEAYGDGSNPESLDLPALERLQAQISAVRVDGARRDDETKANVAKAAELRNSIHASGPDDADDGSGDAGADANADPDADPVDGDVADSAAPEALAASLLSMVTKAVDAAVRKIPVEDLLKDGKPSLNQHLKPALARAAGLAKPVDVPTGRPGTVFAASTDIPGSSHGSRLDTMEMLARAVNQKAATLGISRSGVTNGNMVASMLRDFRYQLSMDSTPAEIDAVLSEATDVENLVAAGGWCAPSEISYDFYNIVCEDGMLDLPSVGVLNRGGFRFPVSPTFADVLNNSPDGLWTWTETDDQAAVTGSPTKDCVRIPCPSFDEVRLVCEGLCLTAGNLTSWAYPENVTNFLKLLTATRAHLTNARIIGILQANSTAVAMNTSSTGNPTGSFYGDLMNAVELQAQHLRAKFAMCNNAMMETILPEWAIGALRSDWSRRTGVDDPNRMESQLISDLGDRNVRAQLIQDYQVRTSGKPGATTAPTAWPATMEFMMYPPGTFVRGQGMDLNLGVVRDSTLNATNDHTAAWMEDCYAVAKIGHLSHKITVNVCVAGTTGAPNIAC